MKAVFSVKNRVSHASGGLVGTEKHPSDKKVDHKGQVLYKLSPLPLIAPLVIAIVIAVLVALLVR
jgi:hypothetical protein